LVHEKPRPHRGRDFVPGIIELPRLMASAWKWMLRENLAVEQGALAGG